MDTAGTWRWHAGNRISSIRSPYRSGFLNFVCLKIFNIHDSTIAFHIRGYSAAIFVGALVAAWPARGLGFIDTGTKWIAVGGGLILIAIMLLTVADVPSAFIARKF